VSHLAPDHLDPRTTTGVLRREGKHNIVVISDLHLGEDLSVDASEQTKRDVAMASAAAADFIRHLAQRKVDGLPWRLVINGDLLDFLSVHVSASDPRLAGVRELGGHSRTDRLQHGAGRVPAASAIRIDMIADKHRPFFRALARLLTAGNRVDIIAGNHDRELVEPEVAARFRAAVVEGGADEMAMSRLELHEWFIYEPGVAWIEHGHQYDETCSFEHGLAPRDHDGEIIANVDTNSVRYLGSVASVDPHSTEEWTFGGYFRYACSLGWKGGFRLAGGYARFVRGLWRASREHKRLRARRRRAQAHDTRISQLAAERGIPRATLDRIDELRRVPVTRGLWRVCRMLMVDRIALGGLALIAAVVIGVLGGWPWGFAGGIGALLAGVLGPELMNRRVPRDPSTALTLVPARIARAARVPLVVFGHTHIAQRTSLDDGAEYVNGGTWLPAIQPGFLRAFTHVVILHAHGGSRAHLRQWRDGKSRPYQPPEAVVALPMPELVSAPSVAKAAAAVAAVYADTTSSFK